MKLKRLFQILRIIPENRIKNLIEVKVTQEDILNGRRHSRASCPVALGLLRSLKNYKVDKLSVVGTLIIFQLGNSYHEITTNEETRNFIINFDCHREVKPFKFTIDLTKK